MGRPFTRLARGPPWGPGLLALLYGGVCYCSAGGPLCAGRGSGWTRSCGGGRMVTDPLRGATRQRPPPRQDVPRSNREDAPPVVAASEPSTLTPRVLSHRKTLLSARLSSVTLLLGPNLSARLSSVTLLLGPTCPLGSPPSPCCWAQPQKDFKKTSGVLKLKNETAYKISVAAVYNHANHSLESLESKALEFTAFKDTRIDTPWLSLVGGDHRLELNISLPKAHQSAKIEDILKFYDAKVTVTWQKAGDPKPSSMDMTNSSMVLGNLEAGMNYCVTVHLRIRINPNTRRSRCVYASTSHPEPSMGPRVLGIAVPLLVLVVVVTVVLLVGLHYTGFLCGIKAHVARRTAGPVSVLSNPYLLLNDLSLKSLSNPYLLLNDLSLKSLSNPCSLMTCL
ncbi:unnamed protein product [Boreogadus saida]